MTASPRLTRWASASRSRCPPNTRSGIGDLQEALDAFAPPERGRGRRRRRSTRPRKTTRRRLADRPLRLAIVGRPNVGKSSLFNRLLGEERSLTGPEAGLTRDAIAAPWTVGRQRDVLLHDTAGLRKRRAAAGQTLEEMSVASTLDAIRFADCVIVMIDATQPFEKQDLTIADLIAREGRAIVFAVNKWDLVENRPGAITDMREQLDGCCRRWRARRWSRSRPDRRRPRPAAAGRRSTPTAPGTRASAPRR